MIAATPAVFPCAPVPRRDPDQRIVLHDVSWQDFERILRIKGEKSVPRLAYLEGELELMSPSYSHEFLKSLIGRLLEVYAEEAGIDISAVGSWTLRSAPKKRGAEPDECFVLGDPETEPARPDLAVEVIWTHGGLDKLQIYGLLGVREVWIWRDDTLSVYELLSGDYRQRADSALFPRLDLAGLCSFLGQRNQSRARREYRAWLRSQPGGA